MKKFKVVQRWSEEVLYSQEVEVEAQTMEEAYKISQNLSNEWSEPEQVDSLGDGRLHNYLVEDLETNEYVEYSDD